MRNVIVGVALVLASACSAEVVRWDGEGCQPACQEVDLDDGASEVRLACIDGDGTSDECSRQSLTAISCAGGGAATCDTEDGLPRCLGGPIERPTCTR